MDRDFVKAEKDSRRVVPKGDLARRRAAPPLHRPRPAQQEIHDLADAEGDDREEQKQMMC